MPRKSRNPVTRAQTIADAWEQFAPDATFAGMTLTQYRNRTKPSFDVRDEHSALRAQQRGKREEILGADDITRLANKQVAAAVRADPTHGSDSPLLAAMDYVTDSMKKSGKTNRNGNGNGQPHP